MEYIAGKETIYRMVNNERLRQDEKWGEQNHNNHKWFIILAEEFGEVAKSILEGNTESFYKELIQIMAVCVAWLECINRRALKKQFKK